MPPAPTISDPRFAQIEGHRPYLMRYALSQLRDGQLAEEAVQECLLAALEAIDGFGGRSTLRTWLTSILRFKVIDLQRRAMSERNQVELTDFAAEAGEEGWLDQLFDDTGHWRQAPSAWGDPEAAFDQRRFWEAFQGSLDKPQPAAGRVFFMRELVRRETDVICKEEGITASNCW